METTIVLLCFLPLVPSDMMQPPQENVNEDRKDWKMCFVGVTGLQ